MYPQYFSQPAATPIVSQYAPAQPQIHREDKILIVGKGAMLPDRCVKCNSPEVSVRKTANLTWVHPLFYLTALLGILVLVILVLNPLPRGPDIPICHDPRVECEEG